MFVFSHLRKIACGVAAAGLAVAGLAATPQEAAARDQFFFSGSFNSWGGNSFGLGYRSGGPSGHWGARPWSHRGGVARHWHRDRFSLGFTYVAPPLYYGPRPYSYYPAPRPSYGYAPAGGIVVFSAPLRERLGARTRGVYFDAYRSALAAPVGEAIDWNDGRVAGSVTTTRDGWAGSRYCREFRQNIVIDGRTEEAYGTACRNAQDTDWEIIPD